MEGLLARRPSPAMIVALVCALTGTAWAALGKVIFDLPLGFRPAEKTVLTFPNSEGEEVISIQGSNVTKEAHDYSGAVVLSGGGSDNYASLNGITFRAEN